jgi:hypothetical protein
MMSDILLVVSVRYDGIRRRTNWFARDFNITPDNTEGSTPYIGAKFGVTNTCCETKRDRNSLISQGM